MITSALDGSLLQDMKGRVMMNSNKSDLVFCFILFLKSAEHNTSNYLYGFGGNLPFLFDHRGPPAIFYHFNRYRIIGGYPCFFFTIIHCLSPGINTILERGHPKFLLTREKIERNFKNPFFLFTVGDSTNKPFVSFAFCHNGIFSGNSFECTGFIPCCRYLSYKFSTLMVAVIECRIVGQHLQSAFEYDK